MHLAAMTLARKGDALTLAIDPHDAAPHGRVRVEFDVRNGITALTGTLWYSCDEMREPLVASYDAFGVDPSGWEYVLTIDREPWRERFAPPKKVSAEYFGRGPFTPATAHVDSALFILRPCAYRWRLLRRERFAP